MAAPRRRCSWCGQPYVRSHPCDPALLAQSEAPKPREAKPREPREPRRAKPSKPPRYDRNYGVGTVARGIVVTPLGYSMVSPAVRARIAERERTGS